MGARLDDWTSVSGQTMELEVGELQRRVGDIGKGAIVVELGTNQGRSACALALACETNHVQGHVVTIDDFDPNTGGGYVIPDMEEAQRNVDRLGLTKYVTIVKSDSAEMASLYIGPLIDLWFHDASHFYEDVKRDIEAWLPHMKPGGLMAFHDYTGEDKGQIGVSQAANEMLGKPIHVSQRLGIFRVKGNDE